MGKVKCAGPCPDRDDFDLLANPVWLLKNCVWLFLFSLKDRRWAGRRGVLGWERQRTLRCFCDRLWQENYRLCGLATFKGSHDECPNRRYGEPLESEMDKFVEDDLLALLNPINPPVLNSINLIPNSCSKWPHMSSIASCGGVHVFRPIMALPKQSGAPPPLSKLLQCHITRHQPRDTQAFLIISADAKNCHEFRNLQAGSRTPFFTILTSLYPQLNCNLDHLNQRLRFAPSCPAHFFP
jgi:hypothetical protein